MPEISRKSRKTSNRRKIRIAKSAKRLLRPDVSRSVLGALFVILGFIFLFTVPTIPQKASAGREPITAGYEFAKNKKESQVTRIIIPKKDIDLEVKPAKISQGYWETSETSASHGEGTANPAEKGNVVIFAHAREGFFYNLRDIKKDDVVYVFTKDQWYKYKVNEIKTVYPNNIETVAPTDREVLTLFTCSGFFDEKRLIVKAYPVRNSE